MENEETIDVDFLILVTRTERKQITQSIDEYLQQGNGINGPAKKRVRTGAPTIIESHAINSEVPREVTFVVPDVYLETIQIVRNKVSGLSDSFSHSILVLTYNELLELGVVVGSELDARLELQAQNDNENPVEPNKEFADNTSSDFSIVVLESICKKLE
jgi:hypothetical protein